MASSMSGGNQVRSTKISVSCLQSSMVVGMSWWKAAWVLQVLVSYISLREIWTPILEQSMIPSLQKLGRRAVFQHDNDSKHTSKTTIALLKRLRVKLGKRVSCLEPNRTSLGILKWKVDVFKVSNICQLHNVVMEERKRIPVATCENLVTSMSRSVKAVLNNDDGLTKYWHSTWCMLILTTFHKGCTHFCWQGFNC